MGGHLDTSNAQSDRSKQESKFLEEGLQWGDGFLSQTSHRERDVGDAPGRTEHNSAWSASEQLAIEPKRLLHQFGRGKNDDVCGDPGHRKLESAPGARRAECAELGNSKGGLSAELRAGFLGSARSARPEAVKKGPDERP